jgi:hypothetical protein
VDFCSTWNLSLRNCFILKQCGIEKHLLKSWFKVSFDIFIDNF